MYRLIPVYGGINHSNKGMRKWYDDVCVCVRVRVCVCGRGGESE